MNFLGWKYYKNLFIALIVLIVLTPFCFNIPDLLNSGGAWGEGSPDDVMKEIGYKPLHMEKYSNLWSAPFPDYNFIDNENSSRVKNSLSYLFSAIVGVLVCGILGYLILLIFKGTKKTELN